MTTETKPGILTLLFLILTTSCAIGQNYEPMNDDINDIDRREGWK